MRLVIAKSGGGYLSLEVIYKMAGMRKLKGKYYARVRMNGREKLVPLNTTTIEMANRRLKFVNEREWFLKIGWEKQFDLEPLPAISKAVDVFLKESRNKGLAQKTIDHYRYVLDHLMNVIKATWKITEITENRCKDLLSYLRERCSVPTVNSYLKTINTFLNWARKRYNVEMPPKIKELPEEKKLPEFLTPDELDRIYDLCEDPKMISTFKVFEHTGIRLRELHNCELDASVSGNYVKLKNTKGKRERIVPIPPEIVEDFKRAKFGPQRHYPSKYEPYKPNYISQTFTELRRKAVLIAYAESLDKDIDELTEEDRQIALVQSGRKSLHSLRHTFALRKLLEWGNIYLVMQALGHADVKTTQVYLEFPEGFLKDVFSDWIPDVRNRLQNLDKTGAKA